MPGKRLLSILLVAAVTLMNALCICQRAHAAAAATPKHACCAKHDHQPSQPHDRDCSHCNGTAAVTAVKNAPDAVPHMLPLVAIVEWPVLTIADISSHQTVAPDFFVPHDSTSLLQLHCALNL